MEDVGLRSGGDSRPVAGPPQGKGHTANSKLNLLGDAEGVVDLDAEIADGAFALRMSEELYGA